MLRALAASEPKPAPFDIELTSLRHHEDDLRSKRKPTSATKGGPTASRVAHRTSGFLTGSGHPSRPAGIGGGGPARAGLSRRSAVGPCRQTAGCPLASRCRRTAGLWCEGYGRARACLPGWAWRVLIKPAESSGSECSARGRLPGPDSLLAREAAQRPEVHRIERGQALLD
jgi:hypothetical protein